MYFGTHYSTKEKNNNCRAKYETKKVSITIKINYYFIGIYVDIFIA